MSSGIAVDCTNWPTGCTTTAQVTNTGLNNGAGYNFVAPFTAYFVYKNTLSQTVLIDSVTWQPSQTSLSDPGFTAVKVPGAGSTLLGFSVTVFFWDSNGVSMGASATQTFSAPSQFYIYYATVGSITVSPQGAQVTQCTSNCVGGMAYYAAYWSVGTTLTVTTSAGVGPVSWGSTPNTNCPPAASGPGFVCSITLSQSTVPVITGNSALSQNVIVVFGQAGANPNQGGGIGTISPTQICLSASAYQTSTFGTCGPSGTFTISTPKGSTWTGNLWSVAVQNTGAQLNPPVTGNSTTVSLTFSQLSGSVTFAGGAAYLYVQVANTVAYVPTLTILQAPYGNGQFASLTPTPGTYTCTKGGPICSPGGTVQLSAVVPNGYQFNGWIVNGQNVGTANPYSLSIPMTGPTSVSAVFIACANPGSCAGGGGGGGGGGGNSTAQAIFFGLAIGGGSAMALGFILPGRRHG